MPVTKKLLASGIVLTAVGASVLGGTAVASAASVGQEAGTLARPTEDALMLTPHSGDGDATFTVDQDAVGDPSVVLEPGSGDTVIGQPVGS
ncbi:hypothetical protein EDF24_1612 [Curtobacterium sp. PhB130]|uniref:hypothetical protein n=1 Tax=unclassified Curtobacterium TaxID=257496 RepID=UPI000F4CE167|nr:MULTISPECIES: hypothetical protein [unclassified Curtobacterium]ROS76036.1 hypothetical protein EDF24_1612 [Curtobacterium sp. PhB130]TCK64267.1 hypothetical protein EDF27_1516 [Curtobacterium sp. PhB136]